MNNIVFVGEHAVTFEVRWHTHDYWELVYCTSGNGAFQFENGTTMSYREGDLVAIPPMEVHTNNSKEGFTNIHMRMQDPSFPYRSAFRISEGPGGHIRDAFCKAQFYFHSDIKRSDLVLSALGELISSYVVVMRSNTEMSEPVENIRGLILHNFAERNFALDEEMQKMPFHYDYLRKLFKKEMGVTPLEYMTRMRMKKAESLLLSMGAQDYSVAEVACLCGYEDPLYFSRVFKKTFGISPSMYASQKGAGKREE